MRAIFPALVVLVGLDELARFMEFLRTVMLMIIIVLLVSMVDAACSGLAGNFYVRMPYLGTL